MSLGLFQAEVFGFRQRNGIVHLYIACSKNKTKIAATDPFEFGNH